MEMVTGANGVKTFFLCHDCVFKRLPGSTLIYVRIVAQRESHYEPPYEDLPPVI